MGSGRRNRLGIRRPPALFPQGGVKQSFLQSLPTAPTDRWPCPTRCSVAVWPSKGRKPGRPHRHRSAQGVRRSFAAAIEDRRVGRRSTQNRRCRRLSTVPPECQPIRRACAGRNNSTPTDQIGAALARRLAARIGFGVNGEGEGKVCGECAVFATVSDQTSGIVRWRSVRIPSAPPGSWREPPWVPRAHNPSTV
jgi:hypothetical protein